MTATIRLPLPTGTAAEATPGEAAATPSDRAMITVESGQLLKDVNSPIAEPYTGEEPREGASHPIIPPGNRGQRGGDARFNSAGEQLKTCDAGGGGGGPGDSPIIITLAEFLAKYDPPDYLVEGLLQRHFLYLLTGMTGGGKTAIAALLAVLVGLRKPGQKFGPHAVEHGRVVYIAAENETDVQMRFPPLLQKFGAEASDLDILVVDRVIDLDRDFELVEHEIRKFGKVDLVIVDTSPRLFMGDNINDDSQMLKHAVRLRKLTRLPGRPCVIALGHPIKRPAGRDDLLPKGGGAYLNECDGNLTLWKHDRNLTDLHWTGKFRGPDFPPITFRLEVTYSPANKDKGGNPLPTVMAMHVTDAEVEAVDATSVDQENQLLSAVQVNPRGSLTDWAAACGWFINGDRNRPNKQQAQRIAKRLTSASPKLLTKKGRGYAITKAGKQALQDERS